VIVKNDLWSAETFTSREGAAAAVGDLNAGIFDKSMQFMYVLSQ
jgi:hypothetical protein